MSATADSTEQESTRGIDADAVARSVGDRRRRGGKKKRSRAGREVERADRHLSRAAHRMARAMERGLATYRKEQRRSARKRRDGALVDLPLNAAEGLAVAMSEASRVPVDLMRAMDSRPVRQAVRLGARLVLLPLPR